MIRLLRILLVLSLVLLPAGTAAQTGVSGESVFSDYLNPRADAGFLRIPGLQFDSSLGVSYSSFGDGESMGMGYYLGHFRLELTSSLSLNWDVGMRSFMTDASMSDSPELFLPNIDLTYKPNDKFMLRLQYQRFSYQDRLHRRSFW